MDSLRFHSYAVRNSGIAKSQQDSVPDPTNSKMKLPSLDKLFPEFPEMKNSNSNSNSNPNPTISTSTSSISNTVVPVDQKQQVMIQHHHHQQHQQHQHQQHHHHHHHQQPPQRQQQYHHHQQQVQQQQPFPPPPPPPQHIRYSSVSGPLPANVSNLHQHNPPMIYPGQQPQQQHQVYQYHQEIPRKVSVTSSVNPQQQSIVSPTVYHNYPSPPPTYYCYNQPDSQQLQQVINAPTLIHQHTAPPLIQHPSQITYNNAFYNQQQAQPTPTTSFMYNNYQGHGSSSPISSTSKTTTNRFKCDQCDKAYTRKHNLISHKLSVHEREKLFQCSKCKVKFSRASDLSRHTKEQHSKLIKPFICAGVNPDGSTWGCGKRFYRKDQLRSHLGTNKAESKCFKRTSNHTILNNGEFGTSAASTFPVVYDARTN